MVSTQKRMQYVSDNDFSWSEEEETKDENVYHRQQMRKRRYKVGSQSRNALIARENRLKKKAYIESLEKQVDRLKCENGKFSKVIDNQSSLIADLKEDVKYLKSVIANSKDIGNLMRTIQTNTGMSVKTSLGQTLSLNNDYLSKPKQYIARKTAHPWDETPMQYPSCLTPDSDLISNLSTQDDLLLNNFELNNVFDGALLDPLPNEMNSACSNQDLFMEHNYTTQGHDSDDDVGVCLHVSKHRVSLEFCSKCSEKAKKNWIAHH